MSAGDTPQIHSQRGGHIHPLSPSFCPRDPVSFLNHFKHLTVGDHNSRKRGAGKNGPGKNGLGKKGPVKRVPVKTVLGKNGPGKKSPSDYLDSI